MVSALPLASVQPVSAPAEKGDLRPLIEVFVDSVERLRTTHEVLQHEVARLKAELASANERLARSQSLALLGEMAAGIAHEVRNPLGSIELYAQMLEEDLCGQPAQSELCGKIRRAVTGLDAIVRDVLSFARQSKIQPQPLAVDDLLDRVLEQVHGVIVRGGVAVRRRAAPRGAMIAGDAGLLIQAIGNVVRNAVEAMTESHAARRTLQISAVPRRCGRPARSGIAVLVRDSGPGFTPEAMSRMFNPFFTTRATGTGLGLSIVHRIIDAHAGHVTVRNRAEGGACVELWLPADRSSVFEGLEPSEEAT